jgi:lambda family phage tail tape measure protein
VPKGAIQFVGDSSQLTAESKKARESVSSVAASAEDARKRIVASYQMQIQAAKDAGASQRELASITARSTSMLAAVSEDNAQRYINAVDKMEERTRRFNAARGSLSAAITPMSATSLNLSGYGADAKAAEELSSAISGVGHSAEYAVAPSVRFGSVIRGMEGSFSRNVRAAEYFGASLKFLEPIMATAFPIVGAATLGYALVQMGKHAYDAFQNIVLLRDAIKGLNQLQINVASTVQKDKDAAESSVESILEATQGKGAALRQRYQYQQQKPVDLSSYFYSNEFKGLTTDEKANYETLYKAIAPSDLPNRLQSIRGEVSRLHSALATIKTSGAFVPKVDGFGPAIDQDPTQYYKLRLTAAQQIQEQLEAGSTAKSAGLQELQIQIPKADKDEQKKRSEEAKAARRQALEAQRAADAAAIQQQNEAHLAWAAAQDRSKLDEVLYWSSFVALTDNGSKRALDARKKYLDANVALNRDLAEKTKQAIGEFSTDYFKDFNASSGLSASDSRSLNRSGADAAAYIASLRESIDLRKRDSDSLAENSIQMAMATGQMTKLDAARALASLHQQQYAERMKDLSEQAAAIKADSTLSDVGRQAALQNNANQVGSERVNRSIQAAQDNYAIAPGPSSGAVGATNALDDFVRASQDSATQMRELTTNTLSGLNQQIVAAMSGQRTNFGNFGAGVFRGVAGVGLDKAEGSVLGMFGLGKLGSQSNPMWTRSADSGKIANFTGGVLGSVFGGGGKSSSGAAALANVFAKSKDASDDDEDSGGISTIGSILTSLLPHYAAGGPIGANTLAVVGEEGPELFASGSGGSIVPNRKISSFGGGGDTHNWNIDARGATDPAQVHKQIMDAAPHIAAAAVKATKENTRRRPSSYR